MKKTFLPKMLSLFLALALFAGGLVSCDGPAEPQNTVIAEQGTTEYVLVRPNELKSDSMTGTAGGAVKLRDALKESMETDIEMKSDWKSKKFSQLSETEKEILVGSTNREESARALRKIREKEFIITLENNRLVITGGNEESTYRACEYFIENFVDKANGQLVVPNDLEIIDRWDYPYSSILIDGIDIRDYTIVYHDSDPATEYTALSLSDMILNAAGVRVEVVKDDAEETEYEILVGKTNRKASQDAASVSLADDEFLLCKSEKKIVMLGNGYLCAGAAGKFMNACLAHEDGKNSVAEAENIPEISAAKPEKPTWKEPKNIILMIGDGMGRNHVLQSKVEWEGDKFPAQAYCTTYSRSVELGNAEYTDSAASATALATGFKTLNGYVGVDENGNPLKNVRELAHEKGFRTAILTTDSITGATPASFLAHHTSRHDSEILQAQINEKIDNGEVEYCKGSLGNELFDSVREALSLISEDENRFFAMIEEAATDHGAHANDMKTVTLGVKRLNECVTYAAVFTMMHPDTALIVTADHETGGITLKDGSYDFTTTSHTNTPVPVYGLGAGTEEFLKSGSVDNLDIARFMANACGAETWGREK